MLKVRPPAPQALSQVHFSPGATWPWLPLTTLILSPSLFSALGQCVCVVVVGIACPKFKVGKEISMSTQTY